MADATHVASHWTVRRWYPTLRKRGLYDDVQQEIVLLCLVEPTMTDCAARHRIDRYIAKLLADTERCVSNLDEDGRRRYYEEPARVARIPVSVRTFLPPGNVDFAIDWIEPVNPATERLSGTTTIRRREIAAKYDITPREASALFRRIVADAKRFHAECCEAIRKSCGVQVAA